MGQCDQSCCLGAGPNSNAQLDALANFVGEKTGQQVPVKILKSLCVPLPLPCCNTTAQLYCCKMSLTKLPS